MPSPIIESLLILQDRDLKRRSLEAQLKTLPAEVAEVEQKIASEKAAIENARAELKALEVQKKAVETDIGAAEQKLGQYKTQQLSIRKNDDYQAMGHQIDLTQQQIGDLEGRELEIMYSIDEAKKRFTAAEAELKAHIAGHEGRIKALRDREQSLREELKTAETDFASARQPVAEPRLRQYDRVVSRNIPAVVPVHGGKCGGCHLKVSSDVESASRGKGVEPTAALPTCDQCGRIVYWEA
jgi:predicted  nucleic acid-binding Zn-ribbon protein